MNKFQVQKISEVVDSDGGKPSAFLNGRMDVMLKNLTDKAATAKNAPVTSTSADCFHFATSSNTPGIEETDDGVHVPLATMIKSFRGNINLAPLRHQDYNSGITFLHYDENKEQLMMYLGASTYFEMLEPAKPDPKPRYWAGPADGHTLSTRAAEDARVSHKPGNPALIYALFHAALKIPFDFQYLYQDPKKLCPPEKKAERSKWASHLDEKLLGEGFVATAAQLGLAIHIVKTLDCATTFINTPYREANGVGMFEVVGWAHFILETEAHLRLDVVNNWRVLENPDLM